MTGILATAQTDVAASPQRVWAALTDPDEIAVYSAGSTVETTWEVGSPITWSGEYNGHPYLDKGVVLTYDEPRVLSMTHNDHTIVYTLTANGDTTRLALSQDGCADEAQGEQFSHNWKQMLEELKAHVEG